MNIRLGVVAVIVSFLALSFAVISPDGWNNVNEKPNYISVIDLAEKIRSREELKIFDLRAVEVYEEFHLPTAENITADVFVSKKVANSKTILYSDDFKGVVELWKSLDVQSKRETFILFGGVNDWYSKLLYPKIPLHINSQDSLLAQKVMDLSKFYGGYIEVVDERYILDYYRQDINKAKPGYTHHTGVLRRKGC